jgi:hypothetical protein
MKKPIYYYLLFLIFVNCSNDNENFNDFKYEYEIIDINYNKYIVESGNTVNKVYGTLAYGYTIDTLEIKLNSSSNGNIQISSNNYLNPNTSEPSNTAPHVNYLYFSDLRPNWESNINKKIFFTKNNSGGIYTTFTYSTSNLNLTNYPELFILNPHIPTYTILQQKEIKNSEKRVIFSDSDYLVGETIFHKTFYAKVLSKKAL